MAKLYKTETDAKADLDKAKKAMAFSDKDVFKIEQFIFLNKTYDYTISMYNSRGNFCGYY